METKATEKRENGIYVQVKGTYHVNVAPNSVITRKNYNLTLLLSPDPNREMPTQKNIQYIMFRKVIPNYFEDNYETYPDYKKIRTCRIEDVFVVNDQADSDEPAKPFEWGPIENMKKKELVSYCIEHDLVTDPKKFTKIADARQAVLDELEDLKIAEEIGENREKEAEAKEKEEFADVEDILNFHKN